MSVTNGNPSNPPAGQGAPGAATPNVLILPAVSGRRWKLGSVLCGYSAAPTGGLLTISWSDLGVAYSILIDLIAAGGQSIPFTPEWVFPVGEAITFTLASGGGSTVARLYPNAWLDN